MDRKRMVVSILLIIRQTKYVFVCIWIPYRINTQWPSIGFLLFAIITYLFVWVIGYPYYDTKNPKVSLIHA